MIGSEERKLRRELASLRVQTRQLGVRNRQLRHAYMLGKRRQLVGPGAILGAGLAGGLTYSLLAQQAQGRGASPALSGLGRVLLRELRLLLLGVLNRQATLWSQLVLSQLQRGRE